jgi:ribonucleotide reductase beta subunit family protein with ferritin-like domain
MTQNLYEEILDTNNIKFTVFPIKYPEVWNKYKEMVGCYWRAEEITFNKDYDDFCKLNSDEQHCIKMILAFFASSDGIVNFNLSERFLKDVTMTEARIAYQFQIMMENVHGEVYSLMLENIIKDDYERNKLYNAVKTIDSVKLMADWAFKWIESTKNFGYRLIAFAIIEGIFFSGAFATIFWLKKYRSNGENFMEGLTKSNEYISRDEGLHCDFACLLYSLLKNKIPEKEVYIMLDDAVEIAKVFTLDSIKCKLIGMNSDMMCSYIEYISDRLLINLGYAKKYNAQNPFDFMEFIGFNVKNNFFESRTTDYQSSANPENIKTKQLVFLENF